MKITKTRLVLGFIGFCVIFSIANPRRAVQETVAEAPRVSSPVASPAPKPKTEKNVAPKASKEVAKTHEERREAKNWHEELCVGDKYWRRNGASTAQQTACQHIITKSLKPETIVLASSANSSDLAEQMVEEGFKKVSFRDDSYSPLSSPENACIVYNDGSVTCHKNANHIAENSATESEQAEEAFKRWDESTCSEVNPDSSIAQRTACQFVQAALLQSGFIVYVGRKSDDAVEILRTSGYQVYDDWREFNPLTESEISACVPYKDDSVACYKARPTTP